MTVLLIDLAILGTIAFCAWRGYKNGLIRGVFGVVSLIVSLLIANISAQAYGDEAKGMLMPFVSGIIDSTLTNMVEEGVEYQPLEHDFDIDDMDFDVENVNFGNAYTALRSLGLPAAPAMLIAEKSMESYESDGGESYFADLIAEHVTTALSFVAVFGIAFLLVAIVFAVIGNLVGFVFSLPGLKLVDMISGAVFGIFKGVIIVYTVAVMVRYFGFLMHTYLENTSILIYIVNNNPIANLLGV